MGTRWPLALLLVAALAIAACGGGSSSGGGGNGSSRAGGSGLSGQAGSGGGNRAATGGSRAAGGSSAPGVRNRFIHDADRLCGRAHSALGRVGRQLHSLAVAAEKRKITPAQYLAGAADLTRKSVATARGALSSIRALPHPGDPRLAGYLRLSATQTALLSVQATALRRGDLRTVRRLNRQLSRVAPQARSLARHFGFHVCGGA